VADLFAGSGALGIEALSRGAAFCLFVDAAAEPAAVVARNLAVTGLAGRARILRRDATQLSPQAEAPFDLVFLDPPYGEGLEVATLARLREGWLAPDGVAVVESAARDADLAADGWTRLDIRTWGAARVSFLRQA
jgi:16S rRNA (guanine966-N2)-methyltransferase